jgi:hypothetical protein
MASQNPLEDLLSAVTDALLAGEDNLDAIVAQYDVPRSTVENLVSFIRRLHQTLVGVQPSPRFVQKLKRELIGTPQAGLVSRVRYLPARVQIAAGVVAIAGFMLLTRRRLQDIAAVASPKDDAEIPVTQ